MEVEVKLRLPDRAAYDHVARLLESGKRVTHQQENFFFDGENKELESTRSVLRLRFYDVDKKAVITMKGKQVLQDGIGRAPEVEEDVPDAAAARAWLAEPTPMLAASPLLREVNQKVGIQRLLCMGGFRNVRTEYEWEGHVLELDETQFQHGTVFEIECETSRPEELREKLEAQLQANGISYTYTTTTKFANFMKKTLV